MAFTAKILSWRFRHLNIVGCLLKRRPTKGGSRAPQDPPSYAPAFMVAYNCHGKTKNLTAKPNASQQKQNSFGLAVGICFCREVFGFCCEVFGFTVRSLILPWGFWFCREVFCFCREVFVFAVRFSVLPWGILFLPWQLWATVNTWYVCRWYIHNYSSWLYIHNWMFLK